MATLMSYHSSAGNEGRCDAKCYDADHPGCDCICGGANHGVVYATAFTHTVELAQDMIAEYSRRTGRPRDEFRIFSEAHAQIGLFEHSRARSSHARHR
jgi:hypothetical protein